MFVSISAFYSTDTSNWRRATNTCRYPTNTNTFNYIQYLLLSKIIIVPTCHCWCPVSVIHSPKQKIIPKHLFLSTLRKSNKMILESTLPPWLLAFGWAIMPVFDKAKSRNMHQPLDNSRASLPSMIFVQMVVQISLLHEFTKRLVP